MRIAPLGRYRAGDADYNPLDGGKLYTYAAGTSTPKTTYQDADGNAENTNPVILDQDGYADVWLDVGAYKFILKDANDVLLWTKDDISGAESAGFGSNVISRSSSFALSINEQNNVIICTAPLTVSLLPAATAGNGFAAVLVNMSSGNVTVDPDGSELINNAASIVIPPSKSAILSTDGTSWFAYGYVNNIIVGGTIDNTPIGQTTPAAGTFTTLICSNFTELSDRRAKKDIVPVEASILGLEPVSYKLLEDDAQRLRHGFIAQDVAETMPELVHEVKGRLTLDYLGLIAPMVKEIKQLRMEVDALKGEVR